MARTSDRTQELLYAIEDAEEDLKVYKFKLKLGIVIFVSGVLLVAGGVAVGVLSGLAGVDMAGLAAALIIPGAIMALASSIMTGLYYSDTNSYYSRSPKRRLKQAQREYNDYVMSQAGL